MIARADWLAGLSPGDKIVYRSSKFGVHNMKLFPVVRITPTQIVCEEGANVLRVRRSDGHCIGRNGIIEPANQDAIDRADKSKILSWMRNDLSLATASLPVLRAMRLAYDEATEKEKKGESA